MNYYNNSSDEALDQLKSSATGLSKEEAQKRLEQNGYNRLTEAKKASLFSQFLKQLAEPMTLVLIAAAVVSGTTNIIAGELHADVFIILAVVLINAILGVYQESKAEQAIEALKGMTADTCRVIRDGVPCDIKSEELVTGDILLIEAGDSLPADGRLIECAGLQIEEAALTGESLAVSKTQEMLTASGDVPLGDRKNMVYSGSVAVFGRGRAVVTATGMSTEMGKIAGALSGTEEDKTPLQKKLHHLSKILTFAVLGICVFIFAFNLITADSINSAIVLDTFMVAVSLAVAAIPEGLATVVTVVLSIGVTNMSKKNAVIRKLTAVETLGCAQIICSDKTGTLTRNRMTVVEQQLGDDKFLAEVMALCSDAELGTDGEAVGEPTECALVNHAKSLGIDKGELNTAKPRVGEAPFESVRKMMSVVTAEGAGHVIYTKGAADSVLDCCVSVLRDGKELPMTAELRSEIEAKNKDMADRALRVLAGAYRKVSAKPDDFSAENLEKELVFVGLSGMIDPVRDEVIPAVLSCREAGIRPIMITGDHIDTAVAIAKQIGIIEDASGAITGAQLDKISDDDFFESVERFGVYARVKPENKTRIVATLRKRGYIVAMTGDGVNDAPSIKNADIGIGMGITGTDVTKNVADMVLADDNFATIVGAVKEGRRIYNNIRKAIQFLLASNLSEVISIFVATLLGFTILKPVHLLFINLITDTFPALALGMESSESDVMQKKPRDPKESIFAGGLGGNVIFQGAMVSVLTLFAYFLGHFMDSGRWEIASSELGMTMAFLTMSMSEVFHSMNMRSLDKSIFSLKTQNKYLWLAMGASFVLTSLVVFVPPFATAFGILQVTPIQYAASCGVALLVIPIVEIAKLVKNLKGAK